MVTEATATADPLANVKAPKKPAALTKKKTSAKKAAKKTSAKKLAKSNGEAKAPRSRKPSFYVLKNAASVDPEKYRGQRKIFVQALQAYSTPKDLATIATKATSLGLKLSESVEAVDSARYHLNALVNEGVVKSSEEA